MLVPCMAAFVAVLMLLGAGDALAGGTTTIKGKTFTAAGTVTYKGGGTVKVFAGNDMSAMQITLLPGGTGILSGTDGSFICTFNSTTGSNTVVRIEIYKTGIATPAVTIKNLLGASGTTDIDVNIP
jgi:hypothetical protein